MTLLCGFSVAYFLVQDMALAICEVQFGSIITGLEKAAEIEPNCSALVEKRCATRCATRCSTCLGEHLTYLNGGS